MWVCMCMGVQVCVGSPGIGSVWYAPAERMSSFPWGLYLTLRPGLSLCGGLWMGYRPVPRRELAYSGSGRRVSLGSRPGPRVGAAARHSPLSCLSFSVFSCGAGVEPRPVRTRQALCSLSYVPSPVSLVFKQSRMLKSRLLPFGLCLQTYRLMTLGCPFGGTHSF